MTKRDKHLEDLGVCELLGQVVDEDVTAIRAWVAAETEGIATMCTAKSASGNPKNESPKNRPTF